MAGAPAGFPSRFVGDPVDTLTGALVERKLEFRMIGPLELSWWRHYDSAQATNRYALGWGQTHAFDRILFFAEDRIIYGQPVGQQSWFPLLPRDGDEASADGFTLRRRSATSYELHRHGEPSMEFVLSGGTRRARPARLFDAKGEIRLFHDARNRLERVVHSTGAVLAVSLNADGLLTGVAVEQPDGTQAPLLTYRYDARGNLVQTEDGAGHGYAFDYDGANRLIQRRGRKGFCFRYRYDAEGRCVFSAGDNNWYGVALTYDVPGRLTTVKKPDGGVWAYKFLPGGKLAEVRDPLGGVRKYLYDAMGRATHEVDPLGNVTEHVLDAAGAPIRRVLPTGHGQPAEEDPNAFDPLEPPIATTAAQYHFGRLLGIPAPRLPTPAELAILDLPATAVAHATTRPDPDPAASKATPYKVQPLGLKWWPAPSHGRVFNELGKLVEQTDEAGRVRQWSYDGSGNLAVHRDFDGGTWRFDYGTWHLLAGLTSPIGATTRFTYTTNEQTASVHDPGGTLSRYDYDQADYLVAVHRHGRTRETYLRDAAGNLVEKHTGDGRLLLRREIGPGNLVTRRVLASGEEHRYVHDKHGRCVRATTKRATVERRYDPLGQLGADLRDGKGLERRALGGGLAEAVWFDRFVIGTRASVDGVVEITDPAGGCHRLRRLGHGFLAAEFANGTRAISQFDDRGRCLLKDIRPATGRAWTRRYSWSGEGELRRVEDSALGEIRHAYDAAHRLTGRLIGGQTEAYIQDAADNLLAQPGLAGVRLRDGNRLAEANGERFDYDDRDHLARRQGAAGRTDYAYDSCDRLVRATTPAGSWTAEYDAFGRRTRKTWNGRTTEFHWSGDQLVAETDPDGRLRLYVYADALALTPILLIDYDSAKAAPESGRVGVIHTDQLGAPVLVEGPRGEVLWQARIAPFGAAAIAPGNRIELALRFPGHYADGELGLHCNGFRHYDPVLGRYLQSDPWGTYGGTNLYAYRTNPLLDADVRGLGEEADKGKPKPPADEEGTAPNRQSIEDRIKDGGNPPQYAKDNPHLYEFDPASGQYRRKEGEGHSRSSEFPSGYRDSTHDEMAARHTDEGRAQGGVPVDKDGNKIPRDQLTWRDENGNQIPFHDENGNTNLTYDHQTSAVQMFNDGATVQNPNGTTTTYPPGRDSPRDQRNDFYNDPNNLRPMSRSDNSSKGGGGQTYNDQPPGPNYSN